MNFIIDNNRIYINTSSSDAAKFKEEIQKLPKEQKQGASVKCYNKFIGFVLSLFGYASKLNLGDGKSLYVSNKSFVQFIVRNKEVQAAESKGSKLGSGDTVIKLHELYLKHQYNNDDVRLVNTKLNNMLEDPNIEINELIHKLDGSIHRHFPEEVVSKENEVASKENEVVSKEHSVPGKPRSVLKKTGDADNPHRAKQRRVKFASEVWSPEGTFTPKKVPERLGKYRAPPLKLSELKAALEKDYDEYTALQFYTPTLTENSPALSKDRYFVSTLIENLIEERLKDSESRLSQEDLHGIRDKVLKDLEVIVISTNEAIHSSPLHCPNTHLHCIALTLISIALP